MVLDQNLAACHCPWSTPMGGKMRKLIFVYNAKAGMLAGVMDSVHKIVSPDTYKCSLCAVTHGFFNMHKAWGRYLKSLPYQTEFYHRRDFFKTYPHARGTALPLVAFVDEGRITPLLSAEMLKPLKTVELLMAALERELPVKL